MSTTHGEAKQERRGREGGGRARREKALQRVRPLAFALGVIETLGDDHGGSLCVLLAFYGFVSLLRLLLLVVTVLGFIGGTQHS